VLKQILIFGTVLVVFATALVINLSILDLLAIAELKQSLGKTVSVIAVSTAAILLIVGIVKLGERKR
jgi:hypothetical protein